MPPPHVNAAHARAASAVANAAPEAIPIGGSEAPGAPETGPALPPGLTAPLVGLAPPRSRAPTVIVLRLRGHSAPAVLERVVVLRPAPAAEGERRAVVVTPAAFEGAAEP